MRGFNEYIQNIFVIPINSLIILETENIFSKYNTFGLRTIDAIQFSCYNLLSDKEIKFVTADDKLQKIIEIAGFSTINPLNYNNI